MNLPDVVLLIEDSEPDQILARYAISKSWPDSTLLIANDGQEAIELLNARAPAYPDLILLDINMPRMNGHDFLKAWYADQRRDIPTVVMLTSSMQEEDRERAFAFSCVRDYTIKPLTGKTLTVLAEQF